MSSKHLATVTFVVAFLALFGLIFLMIWPFMSSIVFALIITGTFYPIVDYLNLQLGMKRQLSAVLACCLVVLIIILPTIYLTIRLSTEAISLYELVQSRLSADAVKNFFFGEGYVASLMQEVAERLNLDYSFETFQKYLVVGGKLISVALLDPLNSIVSNLFSFLFQFFVMLMLIFTLFMEGPRVKRFILYLSPLPDEDEELIMQKFNQMNYVTMVCNGIGGFIQGVLAGVGFWVLGFESVLLWATLMVVLAFIPLVGITIVYVPATIYLLIVGQVWEGVGLFIYCTLVSLVTENWFKPKFVGKRVEINSFLVFFSIIGGMSVFGMGGIFYGPLIITIFLTFVHLYHERYVQYDDDY